MKKDVHKFLLKAHPTNNHPKYFSWVIADICLLIGENDKEKAIKIAYEILKENYWIPLSEFHKSTLIEELIINEGGEILNAYKIAQENGFYLKEYTSNWTGNKNAPPMSFPRITESFMDKVIENVGGKRLEIENNEKGTKPKNADYIIQNFIFELKILEEERLINESVWDSVANVLYEANTSFKQVSAKNLTFDEKNVFINIFRTPIQNAIKSASKQIKSTRKILNNPNLNGGLIIINNGTTSHSPDIFLECVEKSLKNDTNQFSTYLCISNWVKTDGLHSNYLIQIEPKEINNEIQQLISDSFFQLLNDFMNEWARAGFPQDEKMLEPIKNISYEKYGIIFTKYGYS